MIPYDFCKLDFRTIKCNSIDYPKKFKGCKFYNKKLGIIESRDAIFTKKI